MFMAFLLRDNPIAGWSSRPELLVALVIGAAGLGNTIGIGSPPYSSGSPRRSPWSLALLADTAVVLLAAIFYGVLVLALLGLVAGLAQALAKVSLDATIQRDVPPQVQASAFARSDTTLQLAWVMGGFVGIAHAARPALGRE